MHSFLHLHPQWAKHVELTSKSCQQLMLTDHHSTIHQKGNFLWCQLSKSNSHQLLASNWCCTLTSKIIFLPNIFFNQHFLSPNCFASGHFLNTFLTYCPHVLMSMCYLQFNISRVSKSGLLNIVQWYWPNYDINLRFECPLGSSYYTYSLFQKCKNKLVKAFLQYDKKMPNSDKKIHNCHIMAQGKNTYDFHQATMIFLMHGYMPRHT